ncbi:hypothetical protein ACS0PU_009043 [Formica fusca]
MEGEEEFTSEVHEQDENTSYIDICGNIQDFTEVLIGEVQKRPALYNIKSSIQSRSRVIVNQLWQEICQVFEDQIPVEELKRRWKIQRDRYMKIRSDMKKKLPSGSSAAAQKHPNYKYYKLMSFLDDSMEQRKHVSNICLNRKLQPLTSSSNYNTSLRTSHVDSPLSSYAQIQPPLTSPTADFSLSNICSQSSSSSPLTSSESHNFSKSSKRSRRSTTIEDELLRELSTLKEPTPPAVTDSVDLFCRSIADTLRMLDLKSRLSTEMEIMQLLHDKL